MSNKQARLVAAVADAMNDQGFTQKALATAAGMSAGTLSAALSGRYNLSEVKWQLVCEALALDYDDIVAPPSSAGRIGSGNVKPCGAFGGVPYGGAAGSQLADTQSGKAVCAVPCRETAGRCQRRHGYVVG